MRFSIPILALTLAAAANAQPDNTLWATNFGGGFFEVSKIDPIGELITSTPVSSPFGLCVDPFGNVWAGSNGTIVTKLDVNGVVVSTYSVGSFPQSVASDAAGNIWVANRGSDSVTRLTNTGGTLGTTTLPPGTSPIGVIVDPSNQAWVSGFHTNSSVNHDLHVLDAAGTVVNTFTFTAASSGFGFSFPASDATGDIWVANQARSSIMQVSPAGGIVSETPISTGLPRGNQIDGLGFCWLANQGFAGNCVKIDQAGTIVATFPPPGSSFTTCAIDGNGDPWVFGFSSPKAIKLWQVDATSLVEVTLPRGGSAWGGDVGAFHLANNIDPMGDFDGDTAPNWIEIGAGTNPFQANSTPASPLPIQSGLPVPGTTVNYTFRLRADAGLTYIAGLSLGTTPPVSLPDGRTIPLAVPLEIFAIGVLDANGDARAPLSIPITAPTGVSYYTAYVTLDAAAPSGVKTISNAWQSTIR